MKYKLLVVFLTIFLIPTYFKGKEKSYKVISNNPQVSFILELYNKKHSKRNLFTFYYVNSITAENLGKGKADIIIGKDLEDLDPYFKNLEFFYRFLNQDYKEILFKYESFFNSSKLIPLSFNLPILISLEENKYPLYLSLEDIKEIKSKDQTSSLIFNPFLNNKFIWYWSIISHTDWKKNPIGELTWNNANLNNFKEEIKEWATTNDFYTKQVAYSQKYGYLGDLNLLKRKEILLTPSSIEEWLNYKMEGENVSFSFLKANESLIALQEDITYLGLSLFSTPDEEIQAFLRWITSSEGQTEIIKELKNKSPYLYGFLNGFSFIPSINLSIIQEEYPFLSKKIPDTDKIKISYPLPFKSKSFTEKILNPWIISIINEEEISLEKILEKEKYSL